MGDLLPRLVEPVLADRLHRSPVVVVTGARQTGKTTMVRSFAGAAGRRYETLDSLVTLDRARREPEALLLGSQPLTLDEVQRAPELLLAIKEEVDRGRRAGRFLLTGSANLLLLKGIGDSLAGRAAYLTLRPMIEREKRGKRQRPPWSELFAARDADEALRMGSGSVDPVDWRQSALEGGFPPAALAADPIDRRLWLEGYVETYVQRDLRDLAQVGDLGSFVRLMRLAALRTGRLLNSAELARDAGLSRTTAQRWLSILSTSFLLTEVAPFASSRTKRLIKAPKLYFCDTGLALHLCGIANVRDLDELPAAGVWLENIVLNDLLAWRETEIAKPEVHHWRSAGGEEIDFIVERGKRLLPLEIKAGRSVRVRDARALDAFCAEHGPARAPFGVILFEGREPLRLTRTTVALPVGAVL
jgi:hypothetical protein